MHVCYCVAWIVCISVTVSKIIHMLACAVHIVAAAAAVHLQGYRSPSIITLCKKRFRLLDNVVCVCLCLCQHLLFRPTKCNIVYNIMARAHFVNFNYQIRASSMTLCFPLFTLHLGLSLCRSTSRTVYHSAFH